MFIHDAILESITCGNTQVSAADLQRAVTKLKQRDPHTKLTGYEQQHKVWYFHRIDHLHTSPKEFINKLIVVTS